MSRERGEPREPRRIDDSLDRVTRGLGGPTAAALGAVFGRWEEAVGPQVAAHARPLSLVDGTLIIGVDEPIWHTQLTYLAEELRGRLEAVAGPGCITRIELRVRP